MQSSTTRIGFVCLFLSISGCVVADSSAGDVISTGQNVFYASPDSGRKVQLNASPALLTGLKSGERQQVIAVNGQTAWVEGPIRSFGPVLVRSRTRPLEMTVNSTEANPTSERKWFSINDDLNWQLAGATRKTYSATPAYIKDQGRMNLLPENNSPYQLPEVRLTAKDVSGWANILDLKFTTRENLDGSLFYGVILRPFMDMLPMDYRIFEPGTSVVIRNFAYSKPQMTRLPVVPWQLQSVLILPRRTNSELHAVGLASDIKHQSYLLTLLWNSKRISYVGFSGVIDKTVERIPTPVLVNFKLVDVDHDGVDDVLLKIGQITGDDAYFETIEIQGKYSGASDGVKLLSR